MDLLKSVGAAGSSAVITVTGIHPIDVVKTRLQVSGDGGRNYKALGIGGTVSVIASEEGVTAFWKGIGAAWMREASYTSLRLGLYAPIKHAMGVTNESNFVLKFLAGSAAGAIGSIAGNPFDVLKTRMMAAEGKEPPAMSKAASELFRQQGIGGFYRGIEANVMRAMVLNGTKMACYDQIKYMIKKSGSLEDRCGIRLGTDLSLAHVIGLVPAGLPTQFMSAFGAGFFMAVTVSPFDMIRTKLMNQPPNAKIYNGFIDCLVKIVAKDGVGGLYNGFIPIWARFAPTTTLQLVIFENIKPVFGVTDSSGAGG